jgi:transposase InsO family protein
VQLVLLSPFNAVCEALLWVAVAALWSRVKVQSSGQRAVRGVRSMRRSFAGLLVRLGLERPVPPRAWRRGGHNRSSPEVEEAVCRLHVERPDLGLRGLRVLLGRTVGVLPSPSTVRAILMRCRDVVGGLSALKRRPPAHIRVRRKLALWGIDFTLVFVCGVWPVWLLGVVDYHGSRLLSLGPVPRSSAAVVEVLRGLFDEHGVPERLLSDNGREFTAHVVAELLDARGVTHVRTKPAHPWTNGRIERLFRTFKELRRRLGVLFVSRRHLARFCDDFARYYNHCRPHASCWGLTPDEVFRGELSPTPLGEVELFDGLLLAHRFG